MNSYRGIGGEGVDNFIFHGVTSCDGSIHIHTSIYILVCMYVRVLLQKYSVYIHIHANTYSQIQIY